MTREEIEKDRQYQLTGAAIDYCRKELPHYDGEALGEIVDAFEAGAEWADEHPKEGLVNLDKVCEWLENKCENKREYISGLFGGPCSINIMFENISKDLRKAMEEK